MFEKQTKELIGKVLISAITEAPRALYRAAVIVGMEAAGGNMNPEGIAYRAVQIADAVHKKVQEAAGTATGGGRAKKHDFPE